MAEGRSDAEIAVRLGRTPDFVKTQLDGIAAAAGVRGREALAAWWQRRRQAAARPPSSAAKLLTALRRCWPVLLLAAFVALGAAAIALPSGDHTPSGPSFEERRAGTATAAAASFMEAPPPSTCEPPRRGDLRLVTPAELASQGLQRAGHLVRTTHCPLYVANRADRAVAWLAGAGELATDRTEGWRVANARRGVVVFNYTAQPRELLVQVTSDPPDALGRNLAGAGFFPESVVKLGSLSGTGSNLTFAVLSGRGESEQRRIALASNGEVFIDPRPVPREWALNALTGERIDVSVLSPAGRLSFPGQASPRTECRGVCAVALSVPAAGLTAPVDGQLRCRDGADLVWARGGVEYEIDAGDYRLRLRPVGAVLTACGSATAEEAVTAGTLIPSLRVGMLWLFALRADGTLQSLVAAGDGALYVGEAPPSAGCPCTQGSITFPN